MTIKTDPRQPGMVCLCGYWRKQYVVLSRREVPGNDQPVIGCLWDDQWIASHQTPWEEGHDRVLWDGQGEVPTRVNKEMMRDYNGWKIRAEAATKKALQPVAYTGD